MMVTFSFYYFFAFLLTNMAAQKRKTKQQVIAAVNKTEKTSELNPKTTNYEFGGPIGALAMVVILPVIVLFFATCCDSTGYPSQAIKDDWKTTIMSKLNKDFLYTLFDPSAFLIYVGFVAMLAIFYLILPGENIPGVTLRDGTKHKYRMNGKR